MNVSLDELIKKTVNVKEKKAKEEERGKKANVHEKLMLKVAARM